MGFDVVKLTVGTGKKAKHFQVHKNLLSQKAPVFDRMFNGNFAEGEAGEATLSDDNPKSFTIFVSWLYTGTVETRVDERSLIKVYIGLFVLAEKYLITQLADQTMDAFIQRSLIRRTFPDLSMMTLAYAQTYACSKLRLYMARSWSYILLEQDEAGTWTTETMVGGSQDTLNLMLYGLKLIRNLNRKQNLKGSKLMECPRLAPACDYHQHSAEDVCPQSKKRKRNGDGS